MNELTDKIWSGMEARLIDIKHALADQTEEMHRYVFAVPKKPGLNLFEGDFRSLLPKACLRRH
jgi:hypothetical protein